MRRLFMAVPFLFACGVAAAAPAEHDETITVGCIEVAARVSGVTKVEVALLLAGMGPPSQSRGHMDCRRVVWSSLQYRDAKVRHQGDVRDAFLDVARAQGFEAAAYLSRVRTAARVFFRPTATDRVG